MKIILTTIFLMISTVCNAAAPVVISGPVAATISETIGVNASVIGGSIELVNFPPMISISNETSLNNADSVLSTLPVFLSIQDGGFGPLVTYDSLLQVAMYDPGTGEWKILQQRNGALDVSNGAYDTAYAQVNPASRTGQDNIVAAAVGVGDSLANLTALTATVTSNFQSETIGAATTTIQLSDTFSVVYIFSDTDAIIGLLDDVINVNRGDFIPAYQTIPYHHKTGYVIALNASGLEGGRVRVRGMR